MKRSRTCAFLVCLLACAIARVHGQAGSGPEWVVAWKGTERPKTKAGRAIPAARDYSVTYAAEEMAKYMRKVLGTEVKTARWEEPHGDNILIVTDQRYAPEDIRKALQGKRRDAFAIKYPYVLDGRTVCLLVSRDDLGYMFPVYYFLRRYLGVEWVGPEDVGQVVPQQPNWTMPARIDLLEDPDYEHRAWSSPAMDVRRWLAGGRRMQFHHGLHHVFDPRKYGDQPELYSFYEGQRHVPDGSIRRLRISRWQPCTSNPKAVDIAVRYGLEQLHRRPETVSFSLSVNDGGVGYCMCDACLAQDSKDAWDYGNPRLTDRFYRFYNQVIHRVLEESPDAYLAVLGYNRVKTPPVEVKIHPRIAVFNCVDNTNPYVNMAERQKAWKAAGAVPALYFRLPDLGFLTVRHYPHALADMVRLTHELGGFGFYTETATNWAAGGPKFYVLAHVLWDTEADVDELLDRYMQLAFGRAAAPFVRAYFDRWEAVWERGDPDLRYNTTRHNKYRSQLDDLTRADLEAMDAALWRAQAAPASPAEKKRLEYVVAYYQWLRPNADQYLLARELGDEAWVAGRWPEEIFREAERGLELTDEFHRLWETVISKDRSGWLLSVRVEGLVEECWKAFIAPVRSGVLLAYESALDEAFSQITEEMLLEQPRAQVVSYWNEQALRHPKLAPWAKTQAYLLERGPGENLLPNGDFERGAAGQPPQIDGWQVRGAWQGVPCLFAWEAGAGRQRSHAAAIGKGRAGEIAAVAPTPAGSRYRFSMWYKTTDDRRRVFLYGLPAKRLELAASSGQWRHWSTTFTAPANRTTIRMEVKGQDQDQWTWFDDIELIQICEKP